MTRDKRAAHIRESEHPVKIRWATRLPPMLLKRLYDADAKGIQDVELCDEVGMYLFARCRTFYLVHHSQVICPVCDAQFKVESDGVTACPTVDCDWFTHSATYGYSIARYYAWTGRAAAAFLSFYEEYPRARTYQAKMTLIDQLIHSYHLNSKGTAGKSVASKLLDGNKKQVVAFLDSLSARDTAAKDAWRRHVFGIGVTDAPSTPAHCLDETR